MNDDGRPAVFLLQLPLTAPRFSPQWRGRILAVFLLDYSLLVGSYSPSVIPQLIALHDSHDETVVVRQPLQALAIPYVPVAQGNEDEGEGDESSGFDSAQLLTGIPELKARLEKEVRQQNSWVLRHISGAR